MEFAVAVTSDGPMAKPLIVSPAFKTKVLLKPAPGVLVADQMPL